MKEKAMKWLMGPQGVEGKGWDLRSICSQAIPPWMHGLGWLAFLLALTLLTAAVLFALKTSDQHAARAGDSVDAEVVRPRDLQH